MLVLYHSRGALPARLAAALHLGWLPPVPPEPERDLWKAFCLLGGSAIFRAEGLFAAGRDRAGRQVCALGQATRPDVVQRAFGGMAALCGVAPDAYLLQPVGPPVMLGDFRVRALGLCGLRHLARREQGRLLRAGWAEAAEAVEAVRRRLPLQVAEP